MNKRMNNLYPKGHEKVINNLKGINNLRKVTSKKEDDKPNQKTSNGFKPDNDSDNWDYCNWICFGK